jgi:hypothetical protein
VAPGDARELVAGEQQEVECGSRDADQRFDPTLELALPG